MERHGNIALAQGFGGIAWFTLAYVCYGNKEDNSCDDKRSRTVTYPGGLNAFMKATLATLRGREGLEQRASFLCYEKLGDLL